MFSIDKLSVKEQLFFTTVRIAVEKEEKQISGTCFLFHYVKDKIIYPFLVTNRHITENSEKGTLLLRGRKGRITDTSNNITLNFDNFADFWHFPKNPIIDLGVMPFSSVVDLLNKNQKEVFHLPLSNAMIPNKEILEGEIDAIEEIIFIGYPSNIYDRKNYLPIVRKGITATPINVDYNGLPIFLIDASVFHGSSGSPVFIADFSGYTSKKGDHYLGKRRIYFLGILSKGFTVTNSDVLDYREQYALNLNSRNEMVDLGAVTKAKAIVDLIKDLIKRDVSE